MEYVGIIYELCSNSAIFASSHTTTKPLALGPDLESEVTLKSLVWALVLLALIMYVWGPQVNIELKSWATGNAENG